MLLPILCDFVESKRIKNKVICLLLTNKMKMALSQDSYRMMIS